MTGEHRKWSQGLPKVVKPSWLHRPHWTRQETLVWITYTTLVGVAFALVISLTALHAADHRADQKTAQANAAVGAATSANASLSAAGLPTVQVPTSAAPPTATVTVTGPEGATGPGPSDAQVAAAVVSYCGSHSCSTPPSASDVASAVAAFCASSNGCVGPQGSTGPQGPAGQNATADEIAAAVASYCSANNNCQGPAGATGPAGPAGPGVPSFTFTYTDELGVQTHYFCSPDSGDANYSCTSS